MSEEIETFLTLKYGSMFHAMIVSLIDKKEFTEDELKLVENYAVTKNDPTNFKMEVPVGEGKTENVKINIAHSDFDED